MGHKQQFFLTTNKQQQTNCSKNEIKFWKNQNLNSNINVQNQANNFQKSKKFPKKSQDSDPGLNLDNLLTQEKLNVFLSLPNSFLFIHSENNLAESTKFWLI